MTLDLVELETKEQPLTEKIQSVVEMLHAAFKSPAETASGPDKDLLTPPRDDQSQTGQTLPPLLDNTQSMLMHEEVSNPVVANTIQALQIITNAYKLD